MALLPTQVATLKWKEIVFLLSDMQNFASGLESSNIVPTIVSVHFDGEYWVGTFNWEEVQ